jgi:hypothetical protein
MSGRPKSKVTVESQLVPATELGAGACLKFLQEQEAKARESILSAEKALADLLTRRTKNLRSDDGKTADEWDKEIRIAQSYIEIASQEHGHAADRLLKYEKAVEPSKRDAGEKISQEEASKYLTMCAMTLYLGSEELIQRASQEAPLCSNPIDAYAAFGPLFRECMTASIKAAIADGKIPKFASDAILEGWGA